MLMVEEKIFKTEGNYRFDYCMLVYWIKESDK